MFPEILGLINPLNFHRKQHFSLKKEKNPIEKST